MSRLSVVIPTYTITKHLEDLAIMCVGSYLDHCDELIVTEDAGLYSYNLCQLADTYIYNKANGGFTKNVNRGLRFATGDFIAVVNSDTMLRRGDIRDLCIPGKVTSPIIAGQYIERLAGPFFVIPREVLNERGLLLEEMRTYSSDSEYDHRVKDIFQKVESVEVYHEQAQTVTAAGVEGGEEQEKDRKVYEQLIKEGRAAY